MTPAQFRNFIWTWYRKNGRHDLTWRHTDEPWHIFVSEVMLQQTQVSRVADIWPQFIRRFPTPRALATAPLREVLAAWRGMGYNRRAAYLQRAARIIEAEHGGRVPADIERLQALPGIGRNTAGSILAFAFDRPAVFIETNIRRTYLHHFFPGKTDVPDSAVAAWVARTLPKKDFRKWYWALMDYGSAALAGVPNPNRRARVYAIQAKFAGSRRELRGKIVQALLDGGGSAPAIRARVQTLLQGRKISARVFDATLAALLAEGLIHRRGGRIAIRS